MRNSREHILKVSFNLFMQKSYKGVTLKDIVEATGMSKGAFYHYFSSKEELFKEVIRLYFQAGIDTFFNGMPRDNLRTFINIYLQHLIDLLDNMRVNFGFSNSQQGLAYYGMLFDIMRLFPEYDMKTNEHYAMQIRIWEETIRNARKSGEISTLISDIQIARLFVVINDGVVIKFITLGRTDDIVAEMFSLYNSIYSLIKS
jgi:AcrR family transcriptional regulator